MDRKILLIATYFGPPPVWLPAFLHSCGRNRDIDFALFTDCDLSGWSLPNVRVVPCSLRELNNLASRKLGLAIAKGSYAQCDLRPAYGVIFEDHTGGYDYWGHVDLDVVWGRIRHHVDSLLSKEVRILSSREGILSGHFTLWLNDERVNRLFTHAPDFRRILEDPGYRAFDEAGMSTFLESRGFDLVGGRPGVWWERRIVVGPPELEATPLGWRWVDGRVLDWRGREHFYVHFLKWKSTLKGIDFDARTLPYSFHLSPRGFWADRRPAGEVAAQGRDAARVMARRAARLTGAAMSRARGAFARAAQGSSRGERGPQ